MYWVRKKKVLKVMRRVSTISRKLMTDKWKYKSVSLKNSTYSMLNDLSKTLVPGIELSNAKTIEQLILDKNKSKCSLGSKPGGTHGENKKET